MCVYNIYSIPVDRAHNASFLGFPLTRSSFKSACVFTELLWLEHISLYVFLINFTSVFCCRLQGMQVLLGRGRLCVEKGGAEDGEDTRLVLRQPLRTAGGLWLGCHMVYVGGTLVYEHSCNMWTCWEWDTTVDIVTEVYAVTMWQCGLRERHACLWTQLHWE